MVAIEWNSVFETGVREVDDQHRRLVSHINALQNVLDAPDPAVIEHVLESVIDYTLYHFAFEEALLEGSDYPLLDAHKRVHARFAAELHALREQFRAGTLGARALSESLARWVFDHIRSADTSAMRPTSKR